MRRGEMMIVALVFVLLLGMVLLWQRQSALQAGDTVQPVWLSGTAWKADAPASIAVRLQAVRADDSARPLGFQVMPSDANPEAVVTFYKGEESLSPIPVSLSHRC